MINRLCKRLNQNIEVRQSLSSLRQEIKDSSKRELLLSWIHDGDLDLSVFLENEDAKTRKKLHENRKKFIWDSPCYVSSVQET